MPKRSRRSRRRSRRGGQQKRVKHSRRGRKRRGRRGGKCPKEKNGSEFRRKSVVSKGKGKKRGLYANARETQPGIASQTEDADKDPANMHPDVIAERNSKIQEVIGNFDKQREKGQDSHSQQGSASSSGSSSEKPGSQHGSDSKSSSSKEKPDPKPDSGSGSVC